MSLFACWVGGHIASAVVCCREVQITNHIYSLIECIVFNTMYKKELSRPMAS